MTNQTKRNYKFKNRKIFALLLFLSLTVTAFSQSVNVSGNVSDADGPLPGVSIIVKGTTNGVASDFDGNYSLTNVPTNAVLVFTYLGYKSQELPVNGQRVINATLEQDMEQLQEIVVVGYGSMERANVTGAVATVETRELAKAPIPNVVEAMRGQVAGLRVTRGNGQPGSGVSFTIRGLNSLGTDSGAVQDANTPLIVMDGVPLPIGTNMSEFDPDDIETVNILKDAGAASIYGSSGANGVILITTKSGKSGKTQINVNASAGVVDLSRKLPMMNADQYVKYRLDAAITGGNANPTVNNILDGNELLNYINGNEIDWQDELLREGFQNNLGLSFSGGSEKLHFYLNGDMYTESGIVQSSDYKRYSLRFNGDIQATDWLQVGARVQISKSFADETANAITEFNVNGGFAPILPILINTPLGDIYDPVTGELQSTIVDGQQFQVNPLYRYRESQIDREITRTYVNPYINIDLFKGLKYTLNTYAEKRDQFYGEFYSMNYTEVGGINRARIQKQENTNYLVDNILNYSKTFAEKHNLDVTLVYGFQKNEFEQVEIYGENFPTDLLGYNALDDTAASDRDLSWDTDEWGRVYYVGRLQYGFDSRYIATFTIRRDGSSRFGPENRYGYFPSASLAWNAHNEGFLRDSKLNLLKFRLSYGEMGNDRIPTYRYLSNSAVVSSEVISPTGETITVVGYGLPDDGPNPYLKWETSRQTNIGVDFGLFNNRLSGSVDVYKTNTTDLILNELIPSLNGYTQYLSNVGETENKGIEVSLKGNIIETDDFNWEMAVNWAKDQNKIISLTKNDTNADGQPIDDPANGWFIGEDIRAIYEYDYVGVWQLGEEAEAAALSPGFVPGDPKIRDINGDGAITPDDRTILGSPTPDWYGGIRNTFRYKGFELTVLLEAVQGVTTVNNFYGQFSGRENELNIDYWTPNNPTNAFPAAGTSFGFNSTFGNAIRTQDASFVALRNISLQYSLPKKFLNNTFLTDLSFAIRGNNLKYWTDYDHAYSPEAGRGAYPITRTWTFSTTITF